jgi:hypothetical protein
MKIAVKPVVKAPLKKVVAAPKPVPVAAPAPVPVATPLEVITAAEPVAAIAQALEPVAIIAQAPAAPAPVLEAKKEKSHTADPGNLQQTADVNTEPEAEAPESIKVPAVVVNKARSVLYEKDLNSARDQIIKA